jgi:hypothetical protein
MIGEILKKLGITEAEFRELLKATISLPYSWVGGRVVFGAEVEFQRGIVSANSIALPAGAWSPTNDASGFASAALQVKQSSVSVPSPRWLEWLFDASTDEYIVSQFVVPTDFTAAPILRVFYKMASATSGKVNFGCRVAVLSANDAADMDADSYATANEASATVPGTAGYLAYLDIPITNADGMVAGDHVCIALFRDADDGTDDTATGDAEVIGATLRYS